MRERDHLYDLGVDGSIIRKWTLKECDGTSRTRSILLRLGTGDGLL